MSGITAAVIFLLFACYLGIQVLKNFQLRQMNAGLRSKDYETVEKLADMAMSRRLLGEYTCDLYKLRALYLAQDTDRFEDMLHRMIAATYKNPADKKSFLEQYFHTFLLKENRKYADWLLEAIRQTGDEKLARYTGQAYEVIFNQRTDLIAEMDAQIDAKQYYGFPLGVVLFMIAKQYEYLGDEENAGSYYRSAKVCFHPKALYVPVIRENLRRLGQPEDIQEGMRAQQRRRSQ